MLVARIDVSKAGVLSGTRGRLNLIEGTSIRLTLVDDPANEKVDVTITSTAAEDVERKLKEAGLL